MGDGAGAPCSPLAGRSIFSLITITPPTLNSIYISHTLCFSTKQPGTHHNFFFASQPNNLGLTIFSPPCCESSPHTHAHPLTWGRLCTSLWEEDAVGIAPQWSHGSKNKDADIATNTEVALCGEKWMGIVERSQGVLPAHSPPSSAPCAHDSMESLQDAVIRVFWSSP